VGADLAGRAGTARRRVVWPKKLAGMLAEPVPDGRADDRTGPDHGPKDQIGWRYQTRTMLLPMQVCSAYGWGMT